MSDASCERDELIREIARELYDRFVMGGWEPQDAYPQIREWLNLAYAAGEEAMTRKMVDLFGECKSSEEWAAKFKTAMVSPEAADQRCQTCGSRKRKRDHGISYCCKDEFHDEAADQKGKL